MHVSKPDTQIMANVLNGNVKPSAAATQLAIAATSMSLEQREIVETADTQLEGTKQRRYKSSRAYDPRALRELSLSTLKYNAEGRVAAFESHNLNPRSSKTARFIDWEDISIPNPYMAIRHTRALNENFDAALPILCLPIGSRTIIAQRMGLSVCALTILAVRSLLHLSVGS